MSNSKRPSIQGQKHSDLFLTDPAALEPLMRYVPEHWRIWECACGEEKQQLMDAMGFKYGRHVIGTDIRGYGGKDFFTTTPDLGFDCIITNPPYSIKDEWIARCYELGKPFALLLPLTALEGKKRQSLYKEHGLDLLILPKRVDFTTPNGTVGGSWFPVAWFTWNILPERLVFS